MDKAQSLILCEKLSCMARAFIADGIREAKEEFDTASAQMGRKALIKLRGELLRLYGDQQKLASEAQSDSERQMTDGLLADLERISRQAHEVMNFTYTPLEQLAALQ